MLDDFAEKVDIFEESFGVVACFKFVDLRI